MTHLDTSFLIPALVSGSTEDRRLQTWLRSKEHVAVSVIVWTEFLCGPVDPRQVDLMGQVVGESVPFLPRDAALAARLFNLSGRKRGTLTDCMIAATAIRQGASLAISNVGDFSRLEPHGLRLLPL